MSNAAEDLLAEALKLPGHDREELARRLLESLARESRAAKGHARWESLRAARGIVHFGGDAVEDCKRLYDG